MVNASCPVDNKNSILRWSMRVSKDIEDEVGMAIIDGLRMVSWMICQYGITRAM